MISFGELAAHLNKMEYELKFAQDREVRLLMEGAAIEAKAVIGRELSEWPALAPSTIAQKQKLGYTGHVSDTDPLLRTGQLRTSIGAESESAGMTTVGIVGSDDKVAMYQEMGTSRIPPRPFLAPALKSVEPRAEIAFGELAVKALTPGKRL